VSSAERVVFDCNVLIQALISKNGPAHRLFRLAVERRIELFTARYVLAELKAFTAAPRIRTKYRLDDAILNAFFDLIRLHTTLLTDVPRVFDFPRDPADAHYVDLAVAADANLIVSRDKDLLSLKRFDTREGAEFRKRFPGLQILTPPDALKMLDEKRGGT
jgi:putative PIN family toxin of toxin-antitoxin system